MQMSRQTHLNDDADHVAFIDGRLVDALVVDVAPKNQAVRNVLNYNHTHPDFPMELDQLKRYVPKSLVYTLL